jgi:hypothetical protein
MEMIKKYRWWLLGLSAVVLSLLVWQWLQEEETTVTIETTVERKDFQALVVSSGELIAKNSENIDGPEG